jgi:hypothetical protein
MEKTSVTPVAKRYAEALKRVKELKRLYSHIAWYIPVNILILLGEQGALDKLSDIGFSDTDLLGWASWNIRLIPVIWLMVILIQAICMYAHQLKKAFRIKKPLLLRRWEEKQLQKFLEEESSPPPETDNT